MECGSIHAVAHGKLQSVCDRCGLAVQRAAIECDNTTTTVSHKELVHGHRPIAEDQDPAANFQRPICRSVGDVKVAAGDVEFVAARAKADINVAGDDGA